MFGISQKQWKSVLASNLDIEDEECQDQRDDEQKTYKEKKDGIFASETETLVSENAKQETEKVATKYADESEPFHDPGVSVSAFLEETERSDLSDVQRKLLDQIDKDRENILAQPVKVLPHQAREKELSKR